MKTLVFRYFDRRARIGELHGAENGIEGGK